MAYFSSTSKQKLDTCHADLQKIGKCIIAFYDFSIVWGHRKEAAQNEAFHLGNSKLQWPDSKHNKFPSEATDWVPYPGGFQRSREEFTLFAGIVIGVAEMLYSMGEIGHKIRWGGDWDKDGDLKDNSFDDLAHFELYIPGTR